MVSKSSAIILLELQTYSKVIRINKTVKTRPDPKFNMLNKTEITLLMIDLDRGKIPNLKLLGDLDLYSLNIGKYNIAIAPDAKSIR